MSSSDVSDKQPHVLVISFPAQGHVNPMLQFCKRLAAKGIKTTFATTSSFRNAVTINSNSLITFVTFSDGFDAEVYAHIEKPKEYFRKLQQVGPVSLLDLVRKLNGLDAIIYDGFLPWALDVAKQFRMLGAAFFTQTCAVNSIYYQINKKHLKIPLSNSLNLFPGGPQLEKYETPSFVQEPDVFEDVLKLVVDQFDNIEKADWVFFNSFYSLEEEVVKYWMREVGCVKTIGPTLPSMYLDKQLSDDNDYMVNLNKPMSEECMKWLNKKPAGSVVYLSFGSINQPGVNQMKEIEIALIDGGFTFLWVVKSAEKEELFKEFVNGGSENGLVVTWCPQLQVLAHESIGCFVTHCGFNSVIEAIGLGKPMVAMPQWSDQTTNAKYVEDIWGVGVRAKPNADALVSRQVLESCIKEVMEGEKSIEIKKNIMKWSNLAKEAIAEGGSSDKNINEFVAELKKNRTCLVKQSS